MEDITHLSPESFSDCAVLSSLLGEEIVDVVTANMAGAGGLNASMNRLTLTTASGELRSLVLKTFPLHMWEQNKRLGLSREGLFYSTFGKEFSTMLPKVVYSYGDMSTGEKTILFEDLSNCIQAGYYCGPYSPHNWGKDLVGLIGSCPDLDVDVITEKAFLVAAEVHARFWMKKDLLDFPWLRGSQWLCDKEAESFLAAQGVAVSCWEKVKEKLTTEGYKVTWSADIVAIIEASLARASWPDYLIQSKKVPWTLVHGDFHPANMMLRKISHELVLLDWEMVGLGSGPQDLGQFVISHLSPDDRRRIEGKALRAYYDKVHLGTMTSEVDGNIELSWETCQHEYSYGGTERWIWLLLYIAAYCPDALTQFFHDQLLAFTVDHGITAETVGMPRV